MNEHLADGTEVFVAEMGTYGPGEIADLCRWCPPDVAVITAIGPVHLERFGTEDRIVEAKSEILVAAGDVVLPVDDPRLAAVADRAEADGKRVRRCSAVDRSADVCVVRRHVDGTASAYAGASVLAEDVPVPAASSPPIWPVPSPWPWCSASTPATWPPACGTSLRSTTACRRSGPHRGWPSWTTPTTPTRPAPKRWRRCCRRWRRRVGRIGRPPVGRRVPESRPRPQRVVVTPGMVELGTRQAEENRCFGAAIASVADELLIVGRTNRRALLAGVTSVPGSAVGVDPVDHRDQAVAWVPGPPRARGRGAVRERSAGPLPLTS